MTATQRRLNFLNEPKRKQLAGQHKRVAELLLDGQRLTQRGVMDWCQRLAARINWLREHWEHGERIVTEKGPGGVAIYVLKDHA